MTGRPSGGWGAGARLSALLAVSLLLVLALMIWLRPAEDVVAARWAAPLGEQLERMATLVDDADPVRRRMIVAALDGPLMNALISDAPVVADIRQVGPEMATLSALQRQLSGRDLRVGRLAHDELARPRPAVALRLVDGQWLTVALSPRWVRRREDHIGLWWLLVGGVIVFAFWAGHRFTRPLRDFVVAVERFGEQATEAPIAETGPRELRQAIAAFNRMQGRLRALLDDRTRMLIAIAHDLRTMLTRLRLRAEFIDDDEHQRKALADLDTMERMLTGVLDYARAEQGPGGEAPTHLNLAATVQAVVDSFADQGARVAYHGPNRCIVGGRPQAIERAVHNLVDNAIKYGGEADVTVARDDDALAIVTVDDRGPGIPEALRRRVFEPFFRAEPSRSRDTGGTGLGLSLVQALIAREGGVIELADRPGGGLRVIVRLPIP